jgi:hypothetical protein
MLTNKPTLEGQTPEVSPGNYSPVTITIKDSLGAIFLGILSVILLIGWRRSEFRYRKLLEQKKTVDEKLAA